MIKKSTKPLRKIWKKFIWLKIRYYQKIDKNLQKNIKKYQYDKKSTQNKKIIKLLNFEKNLAN